MQFVAGAKRLRSSHNSQFYSVTLATLLEVVEQVVSIHVDFKGFVPDLAFGAAGRNADDAARRRR